jgi:hypothetical protein
MSERKKLADFQLTGTKEEISALLNQGMKKIS